MQKEEEEDRRYLSLKIKKRKKISWSIVLLKKRKDKINALSSHLLNITKINVKKSFISKQPYN